MAFFCLYMRLNFFLPLLIIVFFSFYSCGKRKDTTLFELKESTGIDFFNRVKYTKDFNIFTYRNFYNGGGVAIGDINNDGLADVFFTANMGSNKLYLNKGSWRFDDISENAGFSTKDDWSTGVAMVDINADGWLDIYVCNAGYINGKKPVCQLFINNHDLTFKESAKEYGLTNEGGYTTHAAFFDYDLDGDLDCYILNNSFIPVNTLNYSNKRELRAKDWPVADFLKGGGSYLLRNDNGKFVDVSEQAGIYGSLVSFGLGVTVGDVNGDHYPDIYVSNDFFERDYLYLNQKNGTFKEELEQWMGHISHSSMGADMCDINNDGHPDIFVTEMLPDDDYRLKTTTLFENIDVQRLKVNSGFYHQYMQNTLQVHNGNGKFMETGFYSGVAASDWSWGALMFDMDNDSKTDIYVCNGIYNDVTDQDFIDFFANDVIQKMALTGKKEDVDNIISKMPSHPIVNKTFQNLGDLKFADAGTSWGMTKPSFSNGAAYGDLDNDGDLDLVINNVNQEAFVYKNNSRELNKNNYIGVSLKGEGKNTFAAGSDIKIYTGSEIITREVIPTRGFQSSVDYKVIVGLGDKQADSMIITWPDRTVSKYEKPEVNKVHIIQQQAAKKNLPADKDSSVNTLLAPVHQNFEKHTENDFVDFYDERNIPLLISREGPKVANGDVNGDGLTDVYIGGTSEKKGQLYLQTNTGFTQKSIPSSGQFSDFEDVAVLFFDCDKDGDLDLFIGAGGNNHPPRSRQMQHRLFINDGKGNFEIAAGAFPQNDMNIAVAIANDFDSDGDLDLFVGGRSIPYNYGISPASYLFVNDGKGKFTDIAKEKNPGIANIGLVTGAVWADVTGDKQKDLVIVGEWMTPRIFSFKGGRFEEVKTGLDSLFGWWQSVAANDIDGDGDEDLVLGNIGENFYLQPDEQHPVKLWMNDFDQNGTVEKILTRTVNKKDVSVFLKKDITDQVASLKKQNLHYVDFAKKSIQDLFPAPSIKNSIVKQFTYSSSCFAINDGHGKFTIRKMPVMTQLSSINAIYFTDVNGDGKKDLVLGGNKFGFLPQFCRLDASLGHILINKGEGKYEWMGSGQSGLELRGEIKDIAEIKSKNKNLILFLQNNDYPALYEIKKTANKK